jgi:hypothetical protein
MPRDEYLSQLRIFAEEVMPAFTGREKLRNCDKYSSLGIPSGQ